MVMVAFETEALHETFQRHQQQRAFSSMYVMRNKLCLFVCRDLLHARARSSPCFI